VKIVLQCAFSVPACGTNSLLSTIQITHKDPNFNATLGRATAILGSVIVYEAPLINRVFVLSVFATFCWPQTQNPRWQ
jgi:hypothetical protein